jgi:hypothetical protein
MIETGDFVPLAKISSAVKIVHGGDVIGLARAAREQEPQQQQHLLHFCSRFVL